MFALHGLTSGTGSRRATTNHETMAVANDLLDILCHPNISGLVEAHDDIAAEKYGAKDLALADKTISAISEAPTLNTSASKQTAAPNLYSVPKVSMTFAKFREANINQL